MAVDNEADIIQQMAELGIELRDRDTLKYDGRRHTIGKGGKAWAKLYEWRPDAGGVLGTGSFGSYKTGEWQKVALDLAPLSDAERDRRQREREAREQQAREEREREAESARNNAAELWRKACQEGHSPYLERKRVARPESVRFDRAWLRIPMLRYDVSRQFALQGIQTIKPDGSKLFTAGMHKVGAACRLGLVLTGGLIVVCEGYATGASLREALGYRVPVFVAFDAGNLLPVGRILREIYPDSTLLFCADDDWQTPGNPGRTYAEKAARSIYDAHLDWPLFKPVGRGAKHTDYNDLHVHFGIEEVKRQLALPLRHLQPDAANQQNNGRLRAIG